MIGIVFNLSNHLNLLAGLAWLMKIESVRDLRGKAGSGEGIVVAGGSILSFIFRGTSICSNRKEGLKRKKRLRNAIADYTPQLTRRTHHHIF